MKLLTQLFCTTVATALAFAANNASAVQQAPLPIVKLNISGTITYNDGVVTTNGNTIKASPLKKVRITTKSLIALLNASPDVTNTLMDLTGTNQIPAGSYFIWSPNPIDYIDIYSSDFDPSIALETNVDSVIVTNKNGFSFDLDGIDSVTTNYYYFASLTIDRAELLGTYQKNINTSAGNESDLTGVQFYFRDDNGNEFSSYGNGTMKWKYGKASSTDGTQQTTLKVNFPVPEGFYGSVDYNHAMTLSNFKVSGSGKSMDSTDLNPFYIWWNQRFFPVPQG